MRHGIRHTHSSDRWVHNPVVEDTASEEGISPPPRGPGGGLLLKHRVSHSR